MKSALTHQGEFVRALTSTVSAIVAIQVPMPEPSVARKSRRKLPARRSNPSWRWSGDGTRRQIRWSVGSSGGLQHPAERGREELELVGGADGDPDRGRRAEAGERPHDHALTEQAVEERDRVGAGLGEEEVADRRGADRSRARAGSPRAGRCPPC